MLSCVLIRKIYNIFMDFLKIPNSKYFSFQLFICQYHIWLAADTRVSWSSYLETLCSTLLSALSYLFVWHMKFLRSLMILHRLLFLKDNSSLLKRLGIYSCIFLGLSSYHPFKINQDIRILRTKLFRLTLNLPRGEQHLSGDVL